MAGDCGAEGATRMRIDSGSLVDDDLDLISLFRLPILFTAQDYSLRFKSTTLTEGRISIPLGQSSFFSPAESFSKIMYILMKDYKYRELNIFYHLKDTILGQ